MAFAKLKCVVRAARLRGHGRRAAVALLRAEPRRRRQQRQTRTRSFSGVSGGERCCLCFVSLFIDVCSHDEHIDSRNEERIFGIVKSADDQLSFLDTEDVEQFIFLKCFCLWCVFSPFNVIFVVEITSKGVCMPADQCGGNILQDPTDFDAG
jgi:hypothetical protein